MQETAFWSNLSLSITSQRELFSTAQAGWRTKRRWSEHEML